MEKRTFRSLFSYRIMQNMNQENKNCMHYESISKELSWEIERRIPSPYAFSDAKAIRRDELDKDRETILRSPFIKDTDKILNCPFFNRYSDKTQVFSLYRNDDITRRILHVQLVSRIARTIGKALGLNLELIEAISLGHDIGHPPFAHTGEVFLSRLYENHTGRFFNHSIQSVRVLDSVFPYNMTLATLDGIAFHNGEMEIPKYEPTWNTDFSVFDAAVEETYKTENGMKKCPMPATLEGAVVRISDIISYLGKDRQDAVRAHRITEEDFCENTIGKYNAEIINNLMVNIITESYGKPYITMDEAHFNGLKIAKKENYQYIYEDKKTRKVMEEVIFPMMQEMYERLLWDLSSENKTSPIYTHHIRYVNKAHYTRKIPYENTEPNLLVCDYIAGMTDDYFVDLYHHLFPDSRLSVEYHGYFDK